MASAGNTIVRLRVLTKTRTGHETPRASSVVETRTLYNPYRNVRERNPNASLPTTRTKTRQPHTHMHNHTLCALSQIHARCNDNNRNEKEDPPRATTVSRKGHNFCIERNQKRTNNQTQTKPKPNPNQNQNQNQNQTIMSGKS